MTNPRAWPNNARENRDRAAEELNISIRQLEKFLERVERGEFTRPGLEMSILRILRHQYTAIRHLEKAGAETRPD